MGSRVGGLPAIFSAGHVLEEREPPSCACCKRGMPACSVVFLDATFTDPSLCLAYVGVGWQRGRPSVAIVRARVLEPTHGQDSPC